MKLDFARKSGTSEVPALERALEAMKEELKECRETVADNAQVIASSRAANAAISKSAAEGTKVNSSLEKQIDELQRMSVSPDGAAVLQNEIAELKRNLEVSQNKEADLQNTLIARAVCAADDLTREGERLNAEFQIEKESLRISQERAYSAKMSSDESMIMNLRNVIEGERAKAVENRAYGKAVYEDVINGIYQNYADSDEPVIPAAEALRQVAEALESNAWIPDFYNAEHSQVVTELTDSNEKMRDEVQRLNKQVKSLKEKFR